MTINEFIKKKREEKGISVDDMLLKIGWEKPSYNEMSYLDIELHEDELTTVLSLGEVKRLFQVLGITWNETLDIIFGKRKPLNADSEVFLTASGILKSRIKKMNLSEKEIADEIFVEVSDLKKAQEMTLVFEDWDLSRIIELAEMLEIEPRFFIEKLL
jgi:transcriptional regulator with XRE-family HTH domain